VEALQGTIGIDDDDDYDLVGATAETHKET
jgi:hypothetical protein